MDRFGMRGGIRRADLEEGLRVSRLIGGALLLLVGTLFVLRNFGVVRAGRLGDYWPLLLVWVGGTRLFGPNRSRHFLSGAAILALGVLFQLHELEILRGSWRDLWPLFLVGAGLFLVLESFLAERRAATPPGGAPPPART